MVKKEDTDDLDLDTTTSGVGSSITTTPNSKDNKSSDGSEKKSASKSNKKAPVEPGSPTSNNPVDRKRRDNMNEKIQELLSLIPQPFFDEGKDKSSGTKDGKPNKGQILSKSVEYINHLQGAIDSKNRAEVELSIKLRNLEIANNIPVYQRLNLLHTSAEIGLAKIGVGPLAEQTNSQLQSNSQSNSTTTTPINNKQTPNSNLSPE